MPGSVVSKPSFVGARTEGHKAAPRHHVLFWRRVCPASALRWGGDATAIEGRSYREVMEAATFESGESLFVAADVNWDTDDARLLGKELRVVQTGEPVAIGTPVIIRQRAGRRRLVAGGCVGRVSRWGFVPRCCYHLGATSVEKWKHFTWPFRVFVLAR